MRSSGLIFASQHAIRITDSAEPVGPAPSEATEKSCLIDIRKDIGAGRLVVEIAADHLRAVDQPIPSGSRHLVIGDNQMRVIWRKSLW